MPSHAIHSRPLKEPGSETTTSPRDRLDLLRYAHIFSTVVQEVLELNTLRQVSTESLTLSQFHLLKLISLGGRHQVGQVADFLGVSAPAASKNIDKLERLGLVARRQSKGDRRATLLTPTRKGRRLVERFETLKADRMDPVLEAFDAGEVRQLTHLLERFSISLIDSGGVGEGLCFRCSAYFEHNCPILHYHEGCPYQKVSRGPGDQVVA